MNTTGKSFCSLQTCKNQPHSYCDDNTMTDYVWGSQTMLWIPGVPAVPFTAAHLEALRHLGNVGLQQSMRSSAHFKCVQSSWKPRSVHAVELPWNPGNWIIPSALFQTLEPRQVKELDVIRQSVAKIHILQKQRAATACAHTRYSVKVLGPKYNEVSKLCHQ